MQLLTYYGVCVLRLHAATGALISTAGDRHACDGTVARNELQVK